jgi:nucleotide-binding universal stress UspA family protein
MSPRDLGNGSRTAESRNPVVVGVDGSFTAIRAARWAAAVAAMLEAPLHIVHGRPSLGHNVSDAVADIRATKSEVQRESATAILHPPDTPPNLMSVISTSPPQRWIVPLMRR